MQEINHINVMELIDVFGQKSNISLVLPFMETDLEVLIKDQSIMIVPAHTKVRLFLLYKYCNTVTNPIWLHRFWLHLAKKNEMGKCN